MKTNATTDTSSGSDDSGRLADPSDKPARQSGLAVRQPGNAESALVPGGEVPLVKIDWIVFRTVRRQGEGEYGVPTADSGVDKKIVNAASGMVIACQCDSEPVPEDPQYYFWHISSTHWALMQSRDDYLRASDGKFYERAYTVLLFTDAQLLQFTEHGSPISLIRLAGTEFDLFAKVLQRHEDKESTPLSGGFWKTSPALRPMEDFSASDFPEFNFGKAIYSADKKATLLKAVDDYCQKGNTPPSFATWWSHLRGGTSQRLQLDQFNLVLITPTPKPLFPDTAAEMARALELKLIPATLRASSLLPSDSSVTDKLRTIRDDPPAFADFIRALAKRPGLTTDAWSESLRAIAGDARKFAEQIENAELLVQATLESIGETAEPDRTMANLADEYRAFASSLPTMRQPGAGNAAASLDSPGTLLPLSPPPPVTGKRSETESSALVPVPAVAKPRRQASRAVAPPPPDISATGSSKKKRRNMAFVSGGSIILTLFVSFLLAFYVFGKRRLTPLPTPTPHHTNEKDNIARLKKQIDADFARAFAPGLELAGIIADAASAKAKKAVHADSLRENVADATNSGAADGAKAGEDAGTKRGETEGETLVRRMLRQKDLNALFTPANIEKYHQEAIDEGRHKGSELGAALGKAAGRTAGAEEAGRAGLARETQRLQAVEARITDAAEALRSERLRADTAAERRARQRESEARRLEAAATNHYNAAVHEHSVARHDSAAARREARAAKRAAAIAAAAAAAAGRSARHVDSETAPRSRFDDN